MSKKSKIFRAFKTSLPIAFGYISLGFMAGAMLQKVGFNVFEVFLMSIFIFSGSAMFITANMLAVGINPQISIYLIATIWITNLRNVMYSSSLVSDTKDISGIKKLIFAQFITDETFAINKIEFNKGKDWDGDTALYLSVFGCIYGIIGNSLGAFFGQVVDIPLDLGFFMMSSMFIVLIVLQVNSKTDLLMVIISAIVSFIIFSFYEGGLDLIIVAVIIATIGYFVDKKAEGKRGDAVE